MRPAYIYDYFYLACKLAGNAGNEVLTGLAKLKFDPNLYRVNACQGLVYDPMRKCLLNVCNSVVIVVC